MQYKIFCKLLISLLLFFGLPVYIALHYPHYWLQKIGDISIEEVVERQSNGEFIIFGSGTINNSQYKLSFYDKIQKDVIAIGTSRTMQFREKYFINNNFYTFGGAGDSLASFHQQVDRILKSKYKPKIIIIGMEFWWFEDSSNDFYYQPMLTVNVAKQTYKQRGSLVFNWLLDKKINWEQFFLLDEAFSRTDRFGVNARINNRGFGSDGSYYYTEIITGKNVTPDIEFSDTLDRVKKERSRFNKSNTLPKEKVAYFVENYEKLVSAGIEVILFIPPLASPVYDAMSNKQDVFPHLFHLKKEFAKYDILVHDYSNPIYIDSSDCEFIDGFHGGEVSYVRILKELGNSHCELRKFLNYENIEQAIMDWNGYAYVPDKRVTTLPEIDFLNLSCQK